MASDRPGVCSICGRELATVTCALCGRLVGEKCSSNGVCAICLRGRGLGGPHRPR